MPTDTQTVARLLREYAQRTALRGGNPYRAKAYFGAADSLAALAVPLHTLIDEGRLTEIPGVGESIADIITKLHRSGSHPSLEKLRKEIPAGVLELLAVPGLRPEIHSENCAPEICLGSRSEQYPLLTWRSTPSATSVRSFL